MEDAGWIISRRRRTRFDLKKKQVERFEQATSWGRERRRRDVRLRLGVGAGLSMFMFVGVGVIVINPVAASGYMKGYECCMPTLEEGLLHSSLFANNHQ